MSAPPVNAYTATLWLAGFDAKEAVDQILTRYQMVSGKSKAELEKAVQIRFDRLDNTQVLPIKIKT